MKANAKAAKNEATDLYTQASKLALPDVDTENMETRAVNAQNEAESLMPEVGAVWKTDKVVSGVTHSWVLISLE